MNIYSTSALENLRLCGNRLTVVFGADPHQKSLKTLGVSRNRLEKIDRNFSKLAGPEVLIAQSNEEPLRVSGSLSDLSKLRVVNFKDTEIAEPDAVLKTIKDIKGLSFIVKAWTKFNEDVKKYKGFDSIFTWVQTGESLYFDPKGVSKFCF